MGLGEKMDLQKIIYKNKGKREILRIQFRWTVVITNKCKCTWSSPCKWQNPFYSGAVISQHVCCIWHGGVGTVPRIACCSRTIMALQAVTCKFPDPMNSCLLRYYTKIESLSFNTVKNAHLWIKTTKCDITACETFEKSAEILFITLT